MNSGFTTEETEEYEEEQEQEQDCVRLTFS